MPEKRCQNGATIFEKSSDFGTIFGANNIKKCRIYVVFMFFVFFEKAGKKKILDLILEPILNFRGSQNPPFRASAIAGHLQVHLPNEIT